MNKKLDDELNSINRIYPNSLIKVKNYTYKIIVPKFKNIEILIKFSKFYPNELPKIIDVKNNDKTISLNIQHLNSFCCNKLNQIFNSGEVSISIFIISIQSFLNKIYSKLKVFKNESKDKSKVLKKDEKIVIKEEWVQSIEINDKGSCFIGYAKCIYSIDQIKNYLDEFFSDKKISKASKKITAWRIKTLDNVIHLDFDDDSESGAGKSVFHLIEVSFIF